VTHSFLQADAVRTPFQRSPWPIVLMDELFVDPQIPLLDFSVYFLQPVKGVFQPNPSLPWVFFPSTSVGLATLPFTLNYELFLTPITPFSFLTWS